VAMELNTL